MHVFVLLLRKCTGIYILMRDSVQDITAEITALASTGFLRRDMEQRAARAPPDQLLSTGWWEKAGLGLALHDATGRCSAGVRGEGWESENHVLLVQLILKAKRKTHVALQSKMSNTQD